MWNKVLGSRGFRFARPGSPAVPDGSGAAVFFCCVGIFPLLWWFRGFEAGFLGPSGVPAIRGP